MKFKMIHENYNVSDLDRSIKFYNEALDLHEVRRKTANDFIIVYLSNLEEMALAPPTKPCYDLAVNSSGTNVSKS